MQKKIAYVITKGSIGGAGQYVFDLAAYFKDKNEVSVILGKGDYLKERLEKIQVPVHEIKSLERNVGIFKEWRTFWALYTRFKKERYDIVHLNSSKIGGLGGLAARLAGIPHIIFTGHGWAFNEKRPVYQKIIFYFLHWLTLLFAHTFIANSDATARDVRDLPFVKEKTHTIKLSIGEYERLSRSDARKELSIPDEQFAIGSIAELHSNKGHDVTIEALKQVQHVHLYLIGGGDEEASLKKLAHSCGVQDRVHFLGTIPGAKVYLDAFDVFLLASRTESFGYVLVEAGTASLPVIATRVGAIPEIISHGETGLLVPKENPYEVREAIKTYRDSEHLRKTYGDALHAFVKKEFSLERMLSETEKIYER